MTTKRLERGLHQRQLECESKALRLSTNNGHVYGFQSRLVLVSTRPNTQNFP